MTFPAELKYTKDHEWLKMLDDTTALVGIISKCSLNSIWYNIL